jgi:hypothetical protein
MEPLSFERQIQDEETITNPGGQMERKYDSIENAGANMYLSKHDGATVAGGAGTKD